MSKFYSPLRYPGGKTCISPFVTKLFYENGFIGSSYAEPYAGGAGLALKLLFEEYASEIHINDLDPAIYAFWKCVLEDTDRLCNWIEKVPIDITSWQKYKSIQKNKENVSQFELAQSTFFLNRTNISGVIKGGPIGGLNQNSKYRIDARFNKPELIKRIRRIANFKERINLTNLDGLEFIKSINRKKKDIFVYLDPPYYQKGADLYMNYYSKEDHRQLSTQVHKLKKPWMVSYDNQEFILNLYEKKTKVVYQLSQSTSNRVGDEILIFSHKLNYLDSIQALKSPIKI